MIALSSPISLQVLIASNGVFLQRIIVSIDPSTLLKQIKSYGLVSGNISTEFEVAESDTSIFQFNYISHSQQIIPKKFPLFLSFLCLFVVVRRPNKKLCVNFNRRIADIFDPPPSLRLSHFFN